MSGITNERNQSDVAFSLFCEARAVMTPRQDCKFSPGYVIGQTHTANTSSLTK